MRPPSPSLQRPTSWQKYSYRRLFAGSTSKPLKSAVNKRGKRFSCTLILVTTVLFLLLIQTKLVLTVFRNRVTQQQQQQQQHPSFECAINLFGLPRAFDSLVLPSLIKNVIQPNAAYHCDYFVHFYDLKQEAPGRSGAGGVLEPEQIYHLQQAVLDASKSVVGNSAAGAANAVPPPPPLVKFVKDSEEDFWKQYGKLIETIKTVKDETTTKYRYFPWKAKTYEFPITVVNIIKMWHSIQEAWNLMEATMTTTTTTETTAGAGSSTADNGADMKTQKKQYTRVAMIRSDVVYMTPIDIYTKQSVGDNRDDDNEYVVVPGFGKYPVSDRIVYGPYDAVKIWASERFARMEDHVEQYTGQGWAMHSERFVAYTLFPAMRSVPSVKGIVEHDTMCFFRARVDESVWISDCGGGGSGVDRLDEAVAAASIFRALGPDKKAAVEDVLGRKCGNVTKLNRSVRTLACPTTNGT